MVTYIDAVHPVARSYDGFFVHSRSAGASALSQVPQETVPAPNPTLIRDDLDVPVLVFQTETDVRNAAYRQPDTNRYRLWEVAGARTTTTTGSPSAAPTSATARARSST